MEELYGAVNWDDLRNEAQKASWLQFSRLMAKMKTYNFSYQEFIELAQLLTEYPFDIVFHKKDPRFTYSEANTLIQFFDKHSDPKEEFFRLRRKKQNVTDPKCNPEQKIDSQPVSSHGVFLKCKKCGEVYDHALNFCEMCGNPFSEVRECTCGYQTENPRAKFCGNCKKELPLNDDFQHHTISNVPVEKGAAISTQKPSSTSLNEELNWNMRDRDNDLEPLLNEINTLAHKKELSEDDLIVLSENLGYPDCDIIRNRYFSKNKKACLAVLQWLKDPLKQAKDIQRYDWSYDNFNF